VIDLKEVAEARLAASLENSYVEAFTERFGKAPFLGEQERSVFRWLACTFSEQESHLYLKTFMGGGDAYFVEAGFPPRLLRSQINRIIGASKAFAPKHAPDANEAIQALTACDLCGCRFVWAGKKKAFENPDTARDCPQCVSQHQADLDAFGEVIDATPFRKELREVIKRSCQGQNQQLPFGRICSKMITMKQGGQLGDLDWGKWADACAWIMRLLTENRKKRAPG
jgi:hypothetical protein